ncbi:MAG: RnfABCDGE type electron transport complex subunit D [Candidatus Wallbacteria bacterium]
MAENQKFAVSIHPYIHSPISRSVIYFNRSIVMLVIILSSIYNYGLMALSTTIFASASVLLPEYIKLKNKGRRFADIEYENYYYAFLYSMCLPAGISFYLVIPGGLILYFMLFHNSSNHVFRLINPVPAVLTVMFLAFRQKMVAFNAPRAFLSGDWFSLWPSSEFFDGYLQSTNFASVNIDEYTRNFTGFSKILFNWHPGHFCEVSFVIIILCGIWLAVKKSVDLSPAYASIAGIISGCAFFYFKKGFLNIILTAFSYFIGSLFLFYAFFVLTDYFSLPETRGSRLFYGFMYGALYVVLNINFPEFDPAFFAVLIACSFVPALDYFARRRSERR